MPQIIKAKSSRLKIYTDTIANLAIKLVFDVDDFAKDFIIKFWQLWGIMDVYFELKFVRKTWTISLTQTDSESYDKIITSYKIGKETNTIDFNIKGDEDPHIKMIKKHFQPEVIEEQMRSKALHSVENLMHQFEHQDIFKYENKS